MRVCVCCWHVSLYLLYSCTINHVHYGYCILGLRPRVLDFISHNADFLVLVPEVCIYLVVYVCMYCIVPFFKIMTAPYEHALMPNITMFQRHFYSFLAIVDVHVYTCIYI